MTETERVDGLLAQAVSHHQRGELEHAATLYQEILGSVHDHPDALHLLGVIAAQQGRPAQAITHIEAAIASGGSEPQFCANLGNAYQLEGRLADAVRAYTTALQGNPGDIATAASLGLVLGETGHHQDGVHLLQQVAAAAPNEPQWLDKLGRGLQLAGRLTEAVEAFERVARLRADWPEAQGRISSLRYVLEHLSAVAVFPNRAELIEHALEACTVPGLVLEFGVASGQSLAFICARTQQPVFGFDSFEGLPEHWRSGYEKGAFSQRAPDGLPDNARLVQGWFEDTLANFVAQHAGPARFVHIDCDLFSSTQTVLRELSQRIVSGTVLLFDEYFGYGEWEAHEHRAFQQYLSETGRSFEPIGRTQSTCQFAVRIID